VGLQGGDQSDGFYNKDLSFCARSGDRKEGTNARIIFVKTGMF